MEEYYLKDLVIEGMIIHKHDYIDVIPDTVRMFYKERTGTKSGFDFCAVQFTGVLCDENNRKPNVFDNPDVMVDVIYHGIAYSDGVRHLYMGSEKTGNDGYDYYPDLDFHIAILTALKELESKYCEC